MASSFSVFFYKDTIYPSFSGYPPEGVEVEFPTAEVGREIERDLEDPLSFRRQGQREHSCHDPAPYLSRILDVGDDFYIFSHDLPLPQ